MNTAHDIDLRKEVQGIRRAAVRALMLSAAGFATGYTLLPKLVSFPTTTFDGLVFTLRVNLFILLWVMLAVGLVSHARRQSTADIRGAAFGVPSDAIRIKNAFLQNTLEQGFIAICTHLGFGTLFTGPALSLVVVAAALFAVGRITFYRGYPQGAAARAFGMVTTAIPTLVLLALSMVALASSAIAP
ncbi:MAPEG family protein [Variovorax sp. JS1663]|uniref:MAPEG family protein n=1 Tax=Variovorax sp. JS1663 TaxID=1851577 RepID=UPI00117D0888|nr:MAPEG family protein [Variovorax sp. JS1663]